MLAQNMTGNDDFMPQVGIDCKELLVFRAWAASGWVRVMFYLSLITVFFGCILALIYVGYNGNGAYIFFAVISILLFCVGSVLYARIFFEALMACLQIPRLIFAVDKLESAMRHDLELKSGVIDVIDDGSSPI
eukprot:UN00993